MKRKITTEKVDRNNIPLEISNDDALGATLAEFENENAFIDEEGKKHFTYAQDIIDKFEIEPKGAGKIIGKKSCELEELIKQEPLDFHYDSLENIEN